MEIEPIKEDHPAWLLQQDYTFLASLGQTDFGEIHLVQARRYGERFALKMSAAQADKPELALEMLRREGRMLSRLRHPNIVRLVEDRSEGSDVVPHLLLEYIAGTTLEEYRSSRGGILPCLRLALGVAAAVAYLHRQGIRHNDLHPRNIVIDERAKWPLVIDFGLALDFDDEVDPSLCGLGRKGWVHDDVLDSKPFSEVTEKYQLAQLMAFILELDSDTALASPGLKPLVDHLEAGDSDISADDLEQLLAHSLRSYLAGDEGEED